MRKLLSALLFLPALALGGMIINPFVSFPASNGPPFANVSLLLHCDGSDASTTFTDHSSNGYTVTANGNAQIDTAQSKFGGASGLFDGTGDYLSIANATPLQMGSGDFCIEFWLRVNSLPANRAVLYSKGYTNANGIWIQVMADGSIEAALNGATLDVETAASTISTGTWYHVALTRSGSTLRLFIDGSEADSASETSSNSSTSAVGIGGDFGWYINGWLDDIRVVKGLPVYTTNFTPPTSAHPNS